MPADVLEPFGRDAGDAPGEEARRLGELGGHDPARGFLHERRSRMDPELDAAGAEVVALLGPQADVAEEPGEERAVDAGVLARVPSRFPDLPAELTHKLLQLRLHIAPLAQPVE